MKYRFCFQFGTRSYKWLQDDSVTFENSLPNVGSVFLSFDFVLNFTGHDKFGTRDNNTLRDHGKNKTALTAGFAGNKGIETELPEGVKNRTNVTVRA
jgi:hypothetical protein